MRTVLPCCILTLVLAACGGGSGTGGTPAPGSFAIESAALPPLVSGQILDFEIPLSGGCGGPYRVSVLDGDLPPGVEPDNRSTGPDEHRHHLSGPLAEDGTFTFTVEVLDLGCPTAAMGATTTYTWTVELGAPQIVAAVPQFIPVDEFNDPAQYLDADALEPAQLDTDMAIDFTVAGGQAPFTCTVVDDPTDPDDGPLPLGVNFQVDSCSISGVPLDLGSNGRPFRLTLRVIDARGAYTDRKVQWRIFP